VLQLWQGRTLRPQLSKEKTAAKQCQYTTYTYKDNNTAVDHQSETESSTLTNLVDIHAAIARLEPDEREALSSMMGPGGGGSDFQMA
jgi:DNA-directed RNA polymerase specialized sigma24 family protein